MSGEWLKEPGIWRGYGDCHQILTKEKDLASSVLYQGVGLNPVDGNYEHSQLIIGCQAQEITLAVLEGSYFFFNSSFIWTTHGIGEGLSLTSYMILDK